MGCDNYKCRNSQDKKETPAQAACTHSEEKNHH